MFQIWICRPRAVSITHASREGLPHRRSYAGGSIFGPEISSDTKRADVKCQSVCFDIFRFQGRFGQHTIKTHQISARPKMPKPTRLMSKPRFDIKRVFYIHDGRTLAERQLQKRRYSTATIMQGAGAQARCYTYGFSMFALHGGDGYAEDVFDITENEISICAI